MSDEPNQTAPAADQPLTDEARQRVEAAGDQQAAAAQTAAPAPLDPSHPDWRPWHDLAVSPFEAMFLHFRDEIAALKAKIAG